MVERGRNFWATVKDDDNEGDDENLDIFPLSKDHGCEGGLLSIHATSDHSQDMFSSSPNFWSGQTTLPFPFQGFS